MGGSGCAKPSAGRPDVAPKLSLTGDASCRFSAGGTGAVADDRRRRCEDMVVGEKVKGASVETGN